MARVKVKKLREKASLKNLATKKLGAKQAASVKGGDKSSASLMLACATGEHYKKVKL